ncbi:MULTISPECIES: SDR family NAD(P)-dependent oxidoreductase [unclassified Caballeronia]|uniref:SDR family NAD(P)-dependent oxidoreductase n=1 Tax=unclassified Caballeronia TaxID=2646786 RepID=UPI00025BC729|nr:MULTISPECIES: SDR family NAD(P)-dependent oxidoreductase [unclassified Caballeronia]EKS70278.1 short-chain dehydrogenase/reductase SDR [Burkholderia sp. SJ98]MCE4546450.1 SDR family NAD(P)-dependent oxidoreductase [Caballeronia sp. PC1]MCE4573077.1 SDR family NAD(P)-dependent oxidoreductase [Caballeronia sp. CLC5]
MSYNQVHIMSEFSKQVPLQSGFGEATTAREVVAGLDLAGKTAIVTGGSSGLGFEIGSTLASAGANVVVPARNTANAERALLGIKNVSVAALDLLNPSSIQSFARSFLSKGSSLAWLINNAGVMAAPLHRDNRGVEQQFSANHLGHFQLSQLLMPALRKAEGARVISVSSRAHQLCGVDLEDLHFSRRSYDKWTAYAQSKTANVLFALHLDQIAKQEGIRAFSLHPGSIFTPLARHMTIDDYRLMGAVKEDGTLKTAEDPGFKTVEQGAATTLWCAVSSQLDGLGGLYCEDCDVASLAAEDGIGPGV